MGRLAGRRAGQRSPLPYTLRSPFQSGCVGISSKVHLHIKELLERAVHSTKHTSWVGNGFDSGHERQRQGCHQAASHPRFWGSALLRSLSVGGVTATKKIANL